MKTTVTLSFIFLFAISLGISGCYAQKKINKKYTKFQDRAQKMTKKGAFAVVGIGVEAISREDKGRKKGESDAVAQMSKMKKQYVTTSVHDFRESIGVGKSAEHNDVFKDITEVLSVNLLEGARVVAFDYYVTKPNKKEGTATYIVLYAIDPEISYNIMREKLKGSDEALYQRYVDSEAQKEHDRKIKAYKEEFGVDK